MKERMINPFKNAGVWNIACGVLYALAYISLFIFLEAEILNGGVASKILNGEVASYPILLLIELLLVVFFSVYIAGIGVFLWAAFIIFPFFMILTGVEMLSKHKKGAGVKVLIVFNAIFKLLAVFLNLVFGVQFLTLEGFVVLGGAVLIISAALMLVSIFMDFGALFKREKIA